MFLIPEVNGVMAVHFSRGAGWLSRRAANRISYRQRNGTARHRWVVLDDITLT